MGRRTRSNWTMSETHCGLGTPSGRASSPAASTGSRRWKPDSGAVENTRRVTRCQRQKKSKPSYRDSRAYPSFSRVARSPNILWDSEQIHDMVQGFYDSGQGLLVSTDRRLLFVNRGLLYGLKGEDFPNEKVTSIQYETKLLFGSITIFASGNKAVVSQIQPKARAKAFAEGVRARLAAATPADTLNAAPSRPTTRRSNRSMDDFGRSVSTCTGSHRSRMRRPRSMPGDGTTMSIILTGRSRVSALGNTLDE